MVNQKIIAAAMFGTFLTIKNMILKTILFQKKEMVNKNDLPK